MCFAKYAVVVNGSIVVLDVTRELAGIDFAYLIWNIRSRAY